MPLTVQQINTTPRHFTPLCNVGLWKGPYGLEVRDRTCRHIPFSTGQKADLVRDEWGVEERAYGWRRSGFTNAVGCMSRRGLYSLVNRFVYVMSRDKLNPGKGIAVQSRKSHCPVTKIHMVLWRQIVNALSLSMCGAVCSIICSLVPLFYKIVWQDKVI
jgi:hypothetical protein